jgi:hypothetical protein
LQNEWKETPSERRADVTEQDLPAPVARAVDAVNSGDTDAFLSEFAADGWIDDNGRRFTGHDEMRSWNGFNGYSRFDFDVEDDVLRSMTITA